MEYTDDQQLIIYESARRARGLGLYVFLSANSIEMCSSINSNSAGGCISMKKMNICIGLTFGCGLAVLNLNNMNVKSGGRSAEITAGLLCCPIQGRI